MAVLNPDKNLVSKIRQALSDNDNYCPCSIVKNEDTKCPCLKFRTQKECCCELYIDELQNITK
jgi:ferredoxin-thioredoxin reductase catalytic subunit